MNVPPAFLFRYELVREDIDRKLFNFGRFGFAKLDFWATLKTLNRLLSDCFITFYIPAL